MRRLVGAAAVLAVLLLPAPAFAAENVDIRLQDVNHTGAEDVARFLAMALAAIRNFSVVRGAMRIRRRRLCSGPHACPCYCERDN